MSKEEREKHGTEQRSKVVACFHKYAGNISAIARELHLARITIRYHLKKAGIGKKPLAGGKKRGATPERKAALPGKGKVKRYILTSAQNNTYVHKEFWANVQAMAKHYDAQILIGTFSYNQNNFGRLAVKRDTKKPYEHDLWFDHAIKDYISDEKIELAPGLVWCGTMNILPTEDNPISGSGNLRRVQQRHFPARQGGDAFHRDDARYARQDDLHDGRDDADELSPEETRH